jgi:DNA primase
MLLSPNNIDIVEFISRYVRLERAGRSFKGYCPFCLDFADAGKQSFMVNPDKQIFHCFDCGEGGDARRFWDVINKTIEINERGVLGHPC